MEPHARGARGLMFIAVNVLFAVWLIFGISRTGTTYIDECESLTGGDRTRCGSGDPRLVVGCIGLTVEQDDLCQHGIPTYRWALLPNYGIVLVWLLVDALLIPVWRSGHPFLAGDLEPSHLRGPVVSRGQDRR